MIRPKPLQFGAHIRVIAPSLSMHLLSNDLIRIAQRRFADMGYRISFGKHTFEYDAFASSSIQSRIQDLHDAFLDPNVDGIVCAIGGYNANQLLPYIDFDLIKNNPKIFCGYSDITILLNAITQKSQLVTWYGSHFATFGQKYLDLYEMEYFVRAMTMNDSFQILPSLAWIDDQQSFNDGFWLIQQGVASGLGVGGHLATLSLLQGTPWMPNLAEKILLIEEDMSSGQPVMFDRLLRSILQQQNNSQIAGILIGRFEKKYNMNKEILCKILQTKNLNPNIPIIANVDFGHTEPRCCLPIGGNISINVTSEKILLKIF